MSRPIKMSFNNFVKEHIDIKICHLHSKKIFKCNIKILKFESGARRVSFVLLTALKGALDTNNITLSALYEGNQNALFRLKKI